MARTISTSLVPIPNASAPNAPCVLVCESPHTMVIPGWVSPSCGPMTWTMPWRRVADAVERDAELGAVGLELVDLGERHRVEERQAAVGRRDRMVGRGDGLAGPPDADPAGAQTGERLRAGDLVDEVEVDREDRGRARILGDDVVGPDLLDDGSGCGGCHRASVADLLAGAGKRKERPEGRSDQTSRWVGGDPDRLGFRASITAWRPGRGRGGAACPRHRRTSVRQCHLIPAPSDRAMVARSDRATVKRARFAFTTPPHGRVCAVPPATGRSPRRKIPGFASPPRDGFALDGGPSRSVHRSDPNAGRAGTSGP